MSITYATPIITKTFDRHFVDGWKKQDLDELRSLNKVYLGSGLPNVVREQLAREKRVAFSLLMDCAIRYSFDNQRVTIEDIQSLTRLKTHTIRKALQDSLIKVSATSKRRRGRPTYIYHIPSRETVRKYVTPGNDGMSDHLPEWGLTSISNYRKARYYMMIARGCSYVANKFATYSRALLCEVIGVCKKTLTKYESELDMKVIGNIQETQVTQSNVSKMLTRMKGAFLKVENDSKIDHLPAMRSLAYRALATGAKVTLFQHLPNDYSIGSWDKYKETYL